jgi:hypothetical protein
VVPSQVGEDPLNKQELSKLRAELRSPKAREEIVARARSPEVGALNPFLIPFYCVCIASNLVVSNVCKINTLNNEVNLRLSRLCEARWAK